MNFFSGGVTSRITSVPAYGGSVGCAAPSAAPATAPTAAPIAPPLAPPAAAPITIPGIAPATAPTSVFRSCWVTTPQPETEPRSVMRTKTTATLRNIAAPPPCYRRALRSVLYKKLQKSKAPAPCRLRRDAGVRDRRHAGAARRRL